MATSSAEVLLSPEQQSFSAAAAAPAADATGRIHLDVPEPPQPLHDGAQLNYVVIGAGPSGLLTACLLSKAGKDVTVFDMRDRPTEFYGSFPVVLNMRGLTALSQLGEDMVPQFKKFGKAVDHLHIVQNNKTVAEVDTLGTCIMRDQAVALLLGTADKLGVVVHWKHKLLDLDIAAKTCTFERSVSGSFLKHSAPQETTSNTAPMTIKVAACVVGADGNYSRVRKVCEAKTGLQVETTDWGLQMRYMLAPNPDPVSHPLPPGVDERVHYVLGDGYVCQQPNGVWSLSFSVLPNSPEFLSSSEPTPENVAKLKAYCASSSQVFADNLLTSNEVYESFFTCRAFSGDILKCSSLAPAEWVALIGDAAHAVAPFTGEGINSALESASILANVIIRGGSCTDFDNERREDAHAAYAIACRNRRIVAGAPQQKCANTFGSIVLGIGKKYGCVTGTMQDYMLGRKSENGVWRYSDLISMDRRQRCCLDPCGTSCFFLCCCCCGKCG